MAAVQRAGMSRKSCDPHHACHDLSRRPSSSSSSAQLSLTELTSDQDHRHPNTSASTPGSSVSSQSSLRVRGSMPVLDYPRCAAAAALSRRPRPRPRPRAASPPLLATPRSTLICSSIRLRTAVLPPPLRYPESPSTAIYAPRHRPHPARHNGVPSGFVRRRARRLRVASPPRTTLVPAPTSPARPPLRPGHSSSASSV
ncbi:hypothetical protein B0H15DRAFT_176753 [Mycena belliarum]|uniref:Uncharacterized protein n=1 Tax=Mycena belliarum TaxID=1033014 RepID=A0AAD6TM85_9AGAR|nr:hypothetical protein B0H15DRAFT_176753 [Mycena belliae]